MSRLTFATNSVRLASAIEKVGVAKPPQRLARRLAYAGAFASALLVVYLW